MVWIYIIATVVIFLILKELIRLPTVGKYGERYVFITGCDTGFGNMLAKRLDSLGFNVFAGCLTERGEDELRKVSSDRLKTVSINVAQTDSIDKARDYVEKQLPQDKGLWAVVNNAGVNSPFAATEMLTRADYQSCFAVNLFGVIDVTRAFQPLVRKAQGRFVNMSSIAGRMAAATQPAYVVSKFGVEGFSDCLRREVYKQGMTVHLIEPSGFKTDILNMDYQTGLLQKAYDQSTRDVQLYYGKDFVERAKAKLKFGVKYSSSKTYLVVDAYIHAITAMFPRPRYIVGNDGKYFFRLLWNLPECVTDWILARFTITPQGSQ